MPMKAAFEKYLEDKEGKVKAILVGTRRTDPHGEKLSHFDKTDHGWPAFMRVHPVIDWHYAEIWGVSYFSVALFGLSALDLGLGVWKWGLQKCKEIC